MEVEDRNIRKSTESRGKSHGRRLSEGAVSQVPEDGKRPDTRRQEVDTTVPVDVS